MDLAAAAAAAREVLENAPTVDPADGGDGSPVVSLTELAQAVLAAANPDALVVPVYDAALAQSARYRLEQDTDTTRGAHLSVTAHPGAVALAVYSGGGDGALLVSGLVGPDAVWHLALALASAAMEAERIRVQR